VKRLQEEYEKLESTRTVLCQVFLNSVSEINSASQTALIDIGIQFWWIELEARGCSGDMKDWEPKFDCWVPIIEIFNNVDIQPLLADNGSFFIRDEYSKYGVVNWYQRYKGNIFLQHDLREFPFDRQTFKIKFGATLWGADSVTLRDITPLATKSLFSKGMYFSEWQLVSDPIVTESIEESIEDHRPISYLEVSFNIRRKANYYLTHIVFLVYLINIMSWTVFTLGEDVANRLNMDITLFLALVALNFVVASFIPKMSYSTTLSTYFVVSYALLTLATLENVIIYFITNYHCNAGGDPSYPRNPDPLEPPRCWTAIYFDWTVIALYSVGTSIYTLYFVISGKRTRPGETVHQIHQSPLLPHPPAENTHKPSIYH